MSKKHIKEAVIDVALKSTAMLRVLLLASLVACGLGAVTPLPRPRLDGRIVGGRPVDIVDFPYQVAFEYVGSLRCGGSIISPIWVVTAAHCVDGISPSTVLFRAGSSYRGSGGSLHPAAEFIAHPLYNAWSKDFDVAVARVSIPFTYGTGVQPIAMTNVEPPAGALAVVSGLGAPTSGGSLPSQLQAVEVDIISRAECNNAYGGYGGITENIICSGVTGGGESYCQGDSGGPLVVGGELAGIVPWRTSCADPKYPGVYLIVATLKSWVTNTTGVN